MTPPKGSAPVLTKEMAVDAAELWESETYPMTAEERAVHDALKALAEGRTVCVAAEPVAWLIEKADYSDGHKWLCKPHGEYLWTVNAHDALRYRSKLEAEDAAAAHSPSGYIITDHLFISSGPQPRAWIVTDGRGRSLKWAPSGKPDDEPLYAGAPNER